MKKCIILTIFLVKILGLQLNAQDWSCGSDLTVSHTAGDVAPVDKTITYGTILTSLTGFPKCWITQNLGADQQATSATDISEASAGWYWKFNRKQGYKHENNFIIPVIITVNISENFNWTKENDPCNILLGNGWRIPTSTEWINADANGNWDNYNDTFNSVLKIHAAGCLNKVYSTLNFRGSQGNYWNSTQNNLTYGYSLHFTSNNSYVNNYFKANGYNVRCLKDLSH